MMRRSLFVSLILVALRLACDSNHAAADQPTMVQSRIGAINFSIPDGYQLEQVADDSMTTWPMLVDWAPNGDLLVVESGGVGTPIEEHNKQLLHRVVRLADSNGDGRFDRRTIVADRLPFTQGVLCVGDDVLIASPPVIYRLSQPDDAGVYQQRDVWFDGQTITGCANDLHGPFLGHDGWIYWCKGAFAEQTHELLSGQHLTSTAAHIFRRRLEGGKIEPVMTGGMDNPNGFVMLPNGERFFTSTFLHHPGGGKRDGIVHSVYGGLHGKSHHVLDGHWRTGPLLPVTVEMGAAAPAGLCHWQTPASLFKTSGEVLVGALYNLQKVTAHQLVPVGASYQTRDIDLVVADRIDFHPTDVLPDADGSLLIVDTGGWYDLCCPTSRVDQKAANGGIYRLSRVASTRESLSPDHRQPKDETGVDDLLDRLVDTRRWVARRVLLGLASLNPPTQAAAAEQLIERINDPTFPVAQRLAWLWGLSCLETDTATEFLVSILKVEEPELVVAACHAVSVNRRRATVKDLEWLVTSDRPLAVRRAAAEALGRMGDPTSAKVLLTAAAQDMSDRHWQHSVTYALLELQGGEAARSLLAQPSSSEWQSLTAVLVLDQLDLADEIPADRLLPLVASGDLMIRHLATEVLAKHPDWASTFGHLLGQWFQDPQRDPQGLVAVVAGWRQQAEVKRLIQEWLQQVSAGAPDLEQRLLQVLSVYRHQRLESEWEDLLAAWINRANPDVQLDITRLIGQCLVAENGPLSQTLRQQALSETDLTRQLEFLAALPQASRLNAPGLEENLLQGLEAEEPLLRAQAAAALDRLMVDASTANRLLQRLDRQTINTIMPVIVAISRVHQDQLDKELLTWLPTLPLAKTISFDQLRNLYRDRSPELQALAEQAIATMQRSPDDITAKVQEILEQLPEGDALAGLQVFHGSKANCSACHRLGYVGGELGPELSTIGNSRSRAALLEGILFPNARLEQGYRTTKILTVDGRVYTGLVGKQVDANSFLLQISADQSVVIRHDEIELQEPGTVSIMPSGIGDVLTPQELADLLAILEAAR